MLVEVEVEVEVAGKCECWNVLNPLKMSDHSQRAVSVGDDAND